MIWQALLHHCLYFLYPKPVDSNFVVEKILVKQQGPTDHYFYDSLTFEEKVVTSDIVVQKVTQQTAQKVECQFVFLNVKRCKKGTYANKMSEKRVVKKLSSSRNAP